MTFSKSLTFSSTPACRDGKSTATQMEMKGDRNGTVEGDNQFEEPRCTIFESYVSHSRNQIASL